MIEKEFNDRIYTKSTAKREKYTIFMLQNIGLFPLLDSITYNSHSSNAVLLKIVIHFFKSVNSIIFLFSRMIRFNHRAKSTESISPLPTQNILKHLFYRFKS